MCRYENGEVWVLAVGARKEIEKRGRVTSEQMFIILDAAVKMHDIIDHKAALISYWKSIGIL